MPVGSSSVPAGVTVPDDFDITIVSTTDSQEAVTRALDADDFPADAPAGDDAGDAPAGDDEATAGADGAGEGDGDDAAQDEDGDAGADPVDEPVAGAYEPPVAGETAQQRLDRIERNTRRMQGHTAEKDSRIQTLEDENRSLRDALTRGPRDGEPAKPTVPTPPKFEFASKDEWLIQNQDKTEEDYFDARYDAKKAHEATVTRAEADAKASLEAMQRFNQEMTALSTDVKKHVATVKKTAPDYDKVMKASQSPMSTTMNIAMMRMGEDGVRVAYHLAKPENLAEAQRIYALDPISQVMELDTLRPTVVKSAARGAAPSNGKPAAGARGAAADDVDQIVKPASRRKSSQAPAPARVVSGRASGETDLASLSSDDYMDRMDEQDKRRGRRR